MTLENIVKLQKEYSLIGIPKDIHYRKEALERLLESIEDNEPAIYDALRLDLNKSEMEANVMEVSQVKCIQGTIRCEPYYRTLELSG